MQTVYRALPLMNEAERHLEAAQGWLSLGAFDEAAAELDAIDEAHRLDFPVLVVRAKVFRALQSWEQLLTVGRLLSDTRPDHPAGVLAAAGATRYLRGPVRALGLYMEAVEAFPREAAAFYDLACCEVAAGNVELARMALAEAFKLMPELRAVARVDVDLAGLRGEP